MFGCLKGFKHFYVYPRGREELLLTVKVDPSTPRKPKNEVDDVESPTDVIFLIGAYTRYKCPYVWVRSHHTVLPSGKPVESKDTPLDLHTTSSWKTGNIHIWDIVHELVPLAFSSPIQNPFELDRTPLSHSLSSVHPEPIITHQPYYIPPKPDLVPFLVYGALANFLRKVYLANYPYADLLFRDLQWAFEQHFGCFTDVLPI